MKLCDVFGTKYNATMKRYHNTEKHGIENREERAWKTPVVSVLREETNVAEGCRRGTTNAKGLGCTLILLKDGRKLQMIVIGADRRI